MEMKQETEKKPWVTPAIQTVGVGAPVQLACSSVSLDGCPPGSFLCTPLETCLSCGDICEEPP